MNNELTPFGTNINEILEHRSEADDYEIFSNIAYVVMNKADKSTIVSLTNSERFICAIDAMIREVNNGGFNQFFFNSSGYFTYDLIPALDAVGSIEFKKIAQDALNLFGVVPSLDDDVRSEHLDKITQNDELALWEECDDAFYDCEEQLETMTLDYVTRNVNDIKC